MHHWVCLCECAPFIWKEKCCKMSSFFSFFLRPFVQTWTPLLLFLYRPGHRDAGTHLGFHIQYSWPCFCLTYCSEMQGRSLSAHKVGEKKPLINLITFPFHCLHISLIEVQQVPSSWVLGSVPCPGISDMTMVRALPLRSLQFTGC